MVQLTLIWPGGTDSHSGMSLLSLHALIREPLASAKRYAPAAVKPRRGLGRNKGWGTGWLVPGGFGSRNRDPQWDFPI